MTLPCAPAPAPRPETASIRLLRIMEARLSVSGMRANEMPSGGSKPVTPPWLNSSLRSMNQWMSYWETPKSCSSTPRSQTDAVIWYSGTPTRLPFRSAGTLMPESAWWRSSACMKRRDANTGSATASYPCSGR